MEEVQASDWMAGLSRGEEVVIHAHVVCFCGGWRVGGTGGVAVCVWGGGGCGGLVD